MPKFDYLQTEISYLHGVLPAYFEVGLVALYLLVGALLWSRFMFKWELEDGLEDHLLQAERLGTRTAGETVALMMTKLAFYLFWPLYLGLMYGCKLIGFLRFGSVRHAH